MIYLLLANIMVELEEVISVPDRILVMYEGEIVGEFNPKNVTVEELGLYMAGAKNMYREVGAKEQGKEREAE